MSDMSIGESGVRLLAEKKLGKKPAEEWLWKPNPSLDHSVTPVSLLETGCPACIHQVYQLLEAMP